MDLVKSFPMILGYLPEDLKLLADLAVAAKKQRQGEDAQQWAMRLAEDSVKGDD